MSLNQASVVAEPTQNIIRQAFNAHGKYDENITATWMARTDQNSVQQDFRAIEK
jgi:hypothetical protein